MTPARGFCVGFAARNAHVRGIPVDHFRPDKAMKPVAKVYSPKKCI